MDKLNALKIDREFAFATLALLNVRIAAITVFFHFGNF